MTKPAMDVMVMDRTFARNVLLDTSWSMASVAISP